MYYEEEIKGKLSYKKISGLFEIQAKKVLIWVSITSIETHLAANIIKFKVWLLFKPPSSSKFGDIPIYEAKAPLPWFPKGFASP